VALLQKVAIELKTVSDQKDFKPKRCTVNKAVMLKVFKNQNARQSRKQPVFTRLT